MLLVSQSFPAACFDELRFPGCHADAAVCTGCKVNLQSDSRDPESRSGPVLSRFHAVPVPLCSGATLAEFHEKK